MSFVRNSKCTAPEIVARQSKTIFQKESQVTLSFSVNHILINVCVCVKQSWREVDEESTRKWLTKNFYISQGET